MKENLTNSLEKYLFAIWKLTYENSDIKVKDIAQYMNVGGASTADAVKMLKRKDYINYEPYKNITLTKKGQEKIEVKLYRHKTISNFLKNVLELDTDLAELSADNIEYAMPEIVLKRFVHFLDFMDQCTCKDPKWIKSCKTTLQNGKVSDNCQKCITAGSKTCCGGCKNE